jgi:hypothetical protein
MCGSAGRSNHENRDVILMYAARGMMDSIFRDHELEQFMLVAGLLSGLLTYTKSEIPQPATT